MLVYLKTFFTLFLGCAFFLPGVTDAQATSADIPAAQAAFTEAKTLFDQGFNDNRSPLRVWFEKQQDEAHQVAATFADQAAKEFAERVERRISRIPQPDASRKQYDITFRLVYRQTYRKTLDAQLRAPENIARYHELIAPVLATLTLLRDVLPALAKHDAELKEKQFPRTAKDWSALIDETEKNLVEGNDVETTLIVIEHGIMGEMEAGLMVVNKL